MAEFKVCTFNVNSIKARKELIINWLKKRGNDVDVLCFQELKTTEDKFPYQDFEQLGYKSQVFGQKGYSGVAICSKFKMDEVKKGLGDSYWDQQKRVISAKIKNAFIINVYAPHGGLRGTEKYYYKLDFYKEFKKYLQRYYSPQSPLIIVGDMNVAKEDIDVYDPVSLKDKIGTMTEEREAFNTFLSFGLIDTFRYIYPDKQHFSWWDYIGGRIWSNEGMRIDYILVTEPLKEKLKEVIIDLWPRRRKTPTPSDHAPVIATFFNL
jgi:exodeoxyribonuclease-3